MAGRVPTSVRKMLAPRRTQIVAFELLAALVGIVCLAPKVASEADIIHYIDSKAALRCVIRGFSKKHDLSFIAGRIWFEAGVSMTHYRAEYVTSACNLADGPSRGKLHLMDKLQATRVEWEFPSFAEGLDSWMRSLRHFGRLVV